MEFINKIINYIIDFLRYLFNITEEDIEIYDRMNSTKQALDKNDKPIYYIYTQLNSFEPYKQNELSTQFTDLIEFKKYMNELPYEPDKTEYNIMRANIEDLNKSLFLNALFNNIIIIKKNLLCYLFNLNSETPYYSQFIMSSNPDNLEEMSYDNITKNMDDQFKQLYSNTYDPKLVRLKNNTTLNYYIDKRHSYQIIGQGIKREKKFKDVKRPCESLFLYECYTNVYREIIKNIENFDSFQHFYEENKTLLRDLTIPQCYIPFLTRNNELFEEYKKKNENYILPELSLYCLNEIYDIEYHIIWIVYINIKIRNIIEKNIENNNDDYNKIVSYISEEYSKLLEVEKKESNIHGSFGYDTHKLKLYEDYLFNEVPHVIDNNLWIDKYLVECNFSYELFVNYVLSKENMDEIYNLTNREFHNKIDELYKNIKAIKITIENFTEKMNVSSCDHNETKKIIRNYIKKILKSNFKGGKKKKTYKKKKRISKRNSKKNLV